ncbi:MAG: peptide chain release factor N(5)-glutamine methyltransferase [Trueperaceae bacterium]|nr:MAG: peptide chain release factor N(5)-glutamine methyltransferase [Trueperaceae bacterium]
MTLEEARAQVANRLRAAGIVSAEVEALLLLEAAVKLSRSELILSPSRELTAREQTVLEQWLVRREGREPLQHILARSHFYGLELVVGPGVFIPRPETEQLVVLCLETLRGVADPKVLEVGTGSGAIALAIKCRRPDAEVVATDISTEALNVAATNAQRLGLAVSFLRADLLDTPAVKEIAARVGLMVSNPPYLPDRDRAVVSPEVKRDPESALYGGRSGLRQARRLERQARRLLTPGAVLLMELDPRNVRAALESSRGWADASIFEDLAGRERFLKLVKG